MKAHLPRRRFIQSAMAASALAPFGRLFAADLASTLADVEAVTGDGRQILLKGADVRDFAARLRGPLLLASTDGYEQARHAWNGAFDRHPALIARCTGAADVMEAVKFAAANRLLVSVRGGGHSLSGQSVCDKGLMIDLAQMNGVHVDPTRRIATVEGGALLGALDREALAHGLATTAGTVSHTGVGGLTLGGGFGRLARHFGLTCDNVRAIDLVTADGRFANVNARDDKELFWGLRGGGGNFGVATSFEFQLHPVDPIMLGGSLMYAWEDAPAMLQFYTEYATTQPDELNLDATVMRLPDGTRFLAFDVAWSGPRDKGESVIAPLRQHRKPIRDEVALTPYVKLQSQDDAALAPGHKYYLKAGFVHKATPALVEQIIATVESAKLPVVQGILMPQGGGAIARVKSDATAFAQRAAPHNVIVIAVWDDPAQTDAVGDWTRTSFKNIEPHTRGFYVNDFTPEDVARLSTTYGPNYERMVALKTRVDPNNLFRLNANVNPKARA